MSAVGYPHGVADTPRDPRLALHRFSDRIAGRSADDSLRDGLPGNLRNKLKSVIARLSSGYDSNRLIVARAMDRLDINPGKWELLEDFELLDLINEILLTSVPDNFNRPEAAQLATDQITVIQTALDDTRSLYTIELEYNSDGQVVSPRLGTRVDPAVKLAVEQILSADDLTSQCLRRAWNALTQIQPDNGTAHREAILAIEHALGHLVTPSDKAMQLGKIKGALRDQKWEFSLKRTGPADKKPVYSESGESSVAFLIDLVERIGGSQARRHPDGSLADQHHEEASAAVYAAVSIVGWVRSGTLRKID